MALLASSSAALFTSFYGALFDICYSLYFLTEVEYLESGVFDSYTVRDEDWLDLFLFPFIYVGLLTGLMPWLITCTKYVKDSASSCTKYVKVPLLQMTPALEKRNLPMTRNQ